MRFARRGSRTIASVFVVALFVIVAIAAAVQGVPHVTDPLFALPQVADTRPPPQESPKALGGALDPPTPEASIAVRVIVWIFAIAATALILLLLYRIFRSAWRNRAYRRRAGVETDTDVADVAPARRTVHQLIDDATDALGAAPDAGEGIVAAWLSLETAAVRIGARRGPAETPVEFATRVVARDASSEAEVRALLDLYEDVRFAGRAATEHDRARAQELLQRIKESWR